MPKSSPPRPIIRRDDRNWYQRVRDSHDVGLYIGVLCTELIIWALLALAVVGNRTLTRFHYYLPDTVPASYPYNHVNHFHNQQRQ
ncbi:MAG: hypothetical protein ACRD17_01780 [Terriglobales bacterium]